MENYSIRECKEGSTCDWCGADANSRLFYAPTAENIYVCEKCFGAHYTECDECGEAIEIDDACYFDGDYFCEDCYHDVVC